mmetsp:Transcript_28426/g.34682  ORF Transcript_28426/g.34682 Transcript_28426/m.34682 type:complete len:130 (-) Transcript_28426:504-893(-)
MAADKKHQKKLSPGIICYCERCPNNNQIMRDSRKDCNGFFFEYQGNISYDDSMMLVTIDILSRDDIKLNHFPASVDYVLPVFYSVSFFLCIIEIVLNFSSLNIFSLGIFQTKGYILIFFLMMVNSFSGT